jgi:hypothetical protein
MRNGVPPHVENAPGDAEYADRTVDWRVEHGVDVLPVELRERFVKLGDERDKLVAECAVQASELGKFRAVIVDLLASAHPHPGEHPAMFAAWTRAKKLLAK